MEKQLAQAKQVNSLVEKQLVSTTEVHQESQQKRGPEDQYTRQLETNLVNSRRLVSNPARVVLQIDCSEPSRSSDRQGFVAL
ncbi:MAG TPA: hypothetical protein P5102_01055 [Candidatus Competibacteraceae bacterium]|nr:hypothetical protein [Candidatus Competibacteraceae bacterium]HRZ04735.1 hypothetical protein [Candidatus Competibacteraceae bacterium]HSA46493.1 hypothetical protein [Candidatus Competibacteraceae bacterium]